MALLQYFQDEQLFGREMLVERHFGRAGDGDDGIHASGVDATRLEKLGGDVQDPVFELRHA